MAGRPRHLSPLEQRVLSRFAEWVRERFSNRVNGITFFGSRARGEGRDDSDLDVWIAIVGLSRDERRDVIDFASDLSVDSGLVISPLVVDSLTWKPTPSLSVSLERDGAPL